MSDKERAIATLEKAGFKPYPQQRNLWIKYRPDIGDEDKVKVYPSYDDPDTGTCKATLSVDLADIPTLLAPGYTAEQVEAADKLADVVGSVTFLGNGPNGATIAVGDLTRLAMALDEYRNAKRDGGSHA